METIPETAICVRQQPAAIAEVLSNKVSPYLANMLSALPSLWSEPEAADGTKFQRKRITVEFFYEPSEENRWGDFVTWKITETEVRGKTVTKTTQHFPNIHT